MTNIDRLLTDGQDPKTVEKVVLKLTDLLLDEEEILYMAVQKKPAVNLLPDSIVITNKRIFYCEPGNLGLTMNFKDISWKNIKEVSFKEEFFGAKFICVPLYGAHIVTEYIPKTQARKVYKTATEQLTRSGGLQENQISESTNQSAEAIEEAIVIPVSEAPAEVIEDELMLKLSRLKILYDKQLITLEEYESKKSAILDSL